MDCKLLISEVCLQPIVWNKHDRNHYNLVMKNAVWSEIARKLKTNREDCKKKWKYLKDEYRKALKKETKTPGCCMRFKYYDMMFFLRDHISTNAAANIRDDEEEKSNDEHPLELAVADRAPLLKYEREHFQCVNDIEEKQEAPEDESDEECSKSQIKERIVRDSIMKRKNQLKDAFNALVEQQMKRMEGDFLDLIEENSDDMHFFKSLLPFVRNIPHSEKLKMRTEVQRLILTYVETDRPSTIFELETSSMASWHESNDKDFLEL